MAQIRQCLTFMLKSLDQSLGQEPGLDELDCHDMAEVAANPLALVNGPHAATPDDVDDAILPDPFGRRLILDHRSGHAGRSEEHTSELQSLMRISYAVFCLKKKTQSNICTVSTD